MTLMGIESSSDREEMRNRHEQKLFECKQELLQKYVVPALLKKKFPLLQEFITAEQELFDLSSAESGASVQPTLPAESRIGMLEQYEALLSKQKLALMNAASFFELTACARMLVNLQEEYMCSFLALFKEFSEALPEEVNSREMIDTGKLLLALKQGEPDNKISWAIEREITRIKKIEGIL